MSKNGRIKLILVDDEVLMLSLLTDFLNTKSDIDVLTSFYDGENFIEYLENCGQQPDIVIMDLKMKKMDGLKTSLYMQKHFPDIKIITLSSHYQDSNFGFMIKTGVAAFLPKDISPIQILDVIKEVHHKGRYLSDKQFEVLKNQISSRVPAPVLDSICAITAREKDVLDLLCREYSNADIAAKLNLSIRTIEGHRNNLYSKTDTKNVVGLIVYAFKNSLVDIDECGIC